MPATNYEGVRPVGKTAAAGPAQARAAAGKTPAGPATLAGAILAGLGSSARSLSPRTLQPAGPTLICQIGIGPISIAQRITSRIQTALTSTALITIGLSPAARALTGLIRTIPIMAAQTTAPIQAGMVAPTVVLNPPPAASLSSPGQMKCAKPSHHCVAATPTCPGTMAMTVGGMGTVAGQGEAVVGAPARSTGQASVSIAFQGTITACPIEAAITFIQAVIGIALMGQAT
jgi:hypothetical protein